MPSTADTSYTERLSRLSGAGWKRRLNAQAPYRWNIRRLHPGRTLDVGCGIGRNLGHLDDAVGVDHNPASIAAARELGYRAWTTQEWPACPDAVPGSFDSLLAAHLLEHLDEAAADEILAQYVPYLREDARLILICPQERGYASDETHVRWLDVPEMSAAAGRLGFDVQRAYSFPFPRRAGKVFTYNETVVVAARGGAGSAR